MTKILVLAPALALTLLWIGIITVNETIVTANEVIVADSEVIVKKLFADILTPTETLSRVLDSRKSQDQQEKTIVRSRYVFVNFDNLASKRLPKGAKTIFLNLFPNVSFTAVKDRLVRRSSTQYTWFGLIEGAKHSKVILVVNGQSMVGNIRADGELYQVRVVKGGVHAIYEIDQSAFPKDAPAIPVKMPEHSSLNLIMNKSNGCTTIDVMVVYSDDVADAVADIDTLIQLAIDETNDSYANSNVNQRVRLVHSAEIDYVETGNSSTDLGRLQNPADGFLDDVHTWRDTFGADCVSFWVESMGACGRGYQMETVGPSFAAYAFSVVDRECATGYFSFGHELGHNMGARHDCYVDTGDKPYSYSHGYVNTDDRWRTIMAYDDECDDSGFDCTRIQYWSNPDVTYGGDPMGEEDGGCDSNNAKSLNNTASTVAAFRPEQVLSELISDANGPYSAQCQGVTTTLLLDGTGSSLSDPCDTLSYSWSTTCPGGSFDDSSSPTPALTVDTSLGCSVICDVTLTVSNGDGDSDEDTASVTILLDDFSTDTTGNYETYFWPDLERNVGPNSVEINYDSTNERAILNATGGYGRALMKKKANSLIGANRDFEFSIDFETLNEYNSAIYLGELSNYWENTHLIFRADNYMTHGLSIAVNVEGETIFSDSIPIGNGNNGTLRMKRVNGVYSFYFNDELIWEETFDDLSGLSLHYGALNAITSGPSNWTAKSAFDNWYFNMGTALTGWVWMNGQWWYSWDERNWIYVIVNGTVWHYIYSTGQWTDDNMLAGWVFCDFYPNIWSHAEASWIYCLPPPSGFWLYHYSTGQWMWMR